MNTATKHQAADQSQALHGVIDCREIHADACTQQIAAIVFNNLREHYLDINEEITAHAVSETLYAISFALRRGEILSVEAIGDFIPCLVGEQRVVRFLPAPRLTTPLGIPARPLVRLADQRRQSTNPEHAQP